MKKIKLNKGFTLIELLVVIAIIGILSTLLILQLNIAKSKGRDGKRLTAISQLQTAIEQYYDDEGSYPAALSDALLGKYMQSGAVPLDPQGGTYGYGVDGTGTKYQVWAELENKNAGAFAGDADITGAGWLPGGVTGTEVACTSAAASDCVFDLGIK